MDEIKEGYKVKCIDDHFVNPPETDLSNFNLPKRNEIYTVKKVIKTDGKIGILLEEISLSHLGKNYEPGFLTSRFSVYSK